MANWLGLQVVLSEFEIVPRYFVHLRFIILGEGMKS